jgi:hypothetical protein
MKTTDVTTSGISGRQIALVLAVSALAFLSFYGKSYFSPGFSGMLGYELKDTLCQVESLFRSLDDGSALFWDPVYLQYLPRFPQAPIHSPVTLGLLVAHRVFPALTGKALLAVLLAALVAIQILCALAMFFFLRSRGLSAAGSLVGGLAYAYNHQTYVFGIRHGYDRISAVLFAPFYLLAFGRALDAPTGSPARRRAAALAALLLGIGLVSNGDVKPTFFFALFLVLMALCQRPFSARNLRLLVVVFLLAGAVFAAQALPTLYSLPEQGRGAEPLDSVLEFSLTVPRFLLTQLSTGFTDRRDYPWENTVEFSLSLLPLVVMGTVRLFRRKDRLLWLSALLLCFLWILGKHTPLAPLQGRFMKFFGVRHPVRMAMLLYFCYSFLIAWAIDSLSDRRSNRRLAALSALLPAAVLFFYFRGEGEIPLRGAVACSLSWIVLAALAFTRLDVRAAWLIVPLFLLEKTAFFSTLPEANRGDPTAYYRYDEIYRARPRVEPILRDPDFRAYRAFFGVKDIPDLFSHNFYLNALSDGIRPIFPYFLLDEELRRVREVQEVVFADWSSPMWDLLNVKYFVDLDAYFASWDPEDTSRAGLDHLSVIDGRLRVNPSPEKELFLRYRAEPVVRDEDFLRDLRSGRIDVKTVAYINSADEKTALRPSAAEGAGALRVTARRRDRIAAEVDLPSPAWLVFSEFWFFPWRAELDGQPAPLHRVYHVLMGTLVPAGPHRVRFYFHSHHWMLVLPAVFSSVIALSLAGIAIGRGRRRHRIHPMNLTP